MALTGRIVAAWTPLGKVARYDWRFASEGRMAELLSTARALAKMNAGRTLFFAVALPGSVTFRCQTMKADKLGRVRVRDWWTFPNGNRLLESSSVLGVRRQLNPRGR